MSTYLMHHGIKGQKWGIRRFQNEDGTRTAEGKRREKLADIARRKYGILGMKWGVRRTPEQLGHKTLNPKKTSSRQMLEEWALYANSPGRTANEKTTPLVKKYQKEIEKVKSQKDRHVIGNLKNGERSFDENAFRKNKISAAQAAKIVNKGHDWLDDLSGAMLEDMGYKNTKEARAWLKNAVLDGRSLDPCFSMI